jgi:hypothetical protein
MTTPCIDVVLPPKHDSDQLCVALPRKGRRAVNRERNDVLYVSRRCCARRVYVLTFRDD